MSPTRSRIHRIALAAAILASVPGTLLAQRSLLDKIKDAATKAAKGAPPETNSLKLERAKPSPARRNNAPASTASSDSTQAAPLPDAGDSGTPAATAKIAASAGFIDVAGVKLGMALKDALAIVKGENPRFTTDVFAMDPYELLPKTPLIYAVVAQVPVTLASLKPGEFGEIFGLALSLPPNAPVVYETYRVLTWVNGVGGGGPSVDTIVSGLRQKYGHENTTGTFYASGATFESQRKSGSVNLFWLYDGQGRPLPPVTKNGDPAAGCVTVPMGEYLSREVGNGVGFPGSFEQFRDKSGLIHLGHHGPENLVDKGFDDFYGKNVAVSQKNFALCSTVSSLKVSLSFNPSSGAMAGLVMSAVSSPVARSAFNATHAMLVDAANAQQKRDQDEASKRAAPKF